jgi:integrase/recombinase XerD
MPLSKAVIGFVNHKLAEGLTERSVNSYERLLNKWIEYQGDKDIVQITSDEIRKYLAWLRTDYVPRRYNGKTHPLSPKTLRNIWVTLASFFKWASLDLDLQNPMQNIPPPRFQKSPVEAFTKNEIDALLKACNNTRKAETRYRSSYSYIRPTAKRDRAIILTLLDTGLRAMEICSLTISDVNLKTGRISVEHGVVGGAKGGKGRTVFLGKSSRRSLWRYLTIREDGSDPHGPLFLAVGDRKMSTNALRLLIKRLASKAGVNKAYPHKFRHTFAIVYLRSGGDVFTLQALLGHSTLDMVRHYAKIAEIDIEKAHRKASPVDNWRL